MTMITPSSKLTLTKGNKSWYRAPPRAVWFSRGSKKPLHPGLECFHPMSSSVVLQEEAKSLSTQAWNVSTQCRANPAQRLVIGEFEHADAVGAARSQVHFAY